MNKKADFKQFVNKGVSAVDKDLTTGSEFFETSRENIAGIGVGLAGAIGSYLLSGLWDRKGKNRLSRLLWSVGIGTGLGLGAKFGVKRWDASKSAETEESWLERQREEGMTRELEDRIKQGQAYLENDQKLYPGLNVEEKIAQHQERVKVLREELKDIRRGLEEVRSYGPESVVKLRLYDPIAERNVLVRDKLSPAETIELLEQHRTNLRQQYPKYLKDHPVLSAREAAEMIGPHELAKIYQRSRQ